MKGRIIPSCAAYTIVLPVSKQHRSLNPAASTLDHVLDCYVITYNYAFCNLIPALGSESYPALALFPNLPFFFCFFLYFGLHSILYTAAEDTVKMGKIWSHSLCELTQGGHRGEGSKFKCIEKRVSYL